MSDKPAASEPEKPAKTLEKKLEAAEKFIKQEKIEKFEHKEKPEKFEHKEKPEKIEHKEKPEKIEHKEKIETKEVSKLEHPEKTLGKEKDGKEIAEGGPINPGDPVLLRLAALEQSMAAVQHFITTGQRPDLSRGALASETDTKKP